MKYLKFLLVLLFIPFIVKADVGIISGDNINEEKENNNSSVMFGNNIVSNNLTKGIEALFGNNVDYNGTSDYLVLFGNNVNINGEINNDGFIFGNIININEEANINRDLVILGNEVTINGQIKRDVKVYASSVIINGEITNNLTIKANTIEIEEATINTLSYNKDAIINISEKAQIKDTILTDEISQNYSLLDNIMNYFINLVGTLILFMAICLLLPQLFKRINKKNATINTLNFFSLFGFGALSLILIPIIIFLLFGFPFTISLALLILTLFIIAICLANIFTGYLIGYIIWKFLKKEDNYLLIGLIGITILNTLIAIPNFGFIFSFIAIMVGMGIILQQFKKD